ncbi:hypothetical protein CAOG_05744, partial [Capsaspora owczarzaki ATCC 30864]|uniref:hypothetical protein n=1 Tax=Capsaspora owczarzaki (strain ATCC 30864) TaxID=595528 RepID=UPI0003522DCE
VVAMSGPQRVVSLRTSLTSRVCTALMLAAGFQPVLMLVPFTSLNVLRAVYRTHYNTTTLPDQAVQATWWLNATAPASEEVWRPTLLTFSEPLVFLTNAVAALLVISIFTVDIAAVGSTLTQLHLKKSFSALLGLQALLLGSIMLATPFPLVWDLQDTARQLATCTLGLTIVQHCWIVIAFRVKAIRVALRVANQRRESPGPGAFFTSLHSLKPFQTSDTPLLAIHNAACIATAVLLLLASPKSMLAGVLAALSLALILPERLMFSPAPRSLTFVKFAHHPWSMVRALLSASWYYGKAPATFLPPDTAASAFWDALPCFSCALGVLSLFLSSCTFVEDAFDRWVTILDWRPVHFESLPPLLAALLLVPWHLVFSLRAFWCARWARGSTPSIEAMFQAETQAESEFLRNEASRDHPSDASIKMTRRRRFVVNSLPSSAPLSSASEPLPETKSTNPLPPATSMQLFSFVLHAMQWWQHAAGLGLICVALWFYQSRLLLVSCCWGLVEVFLFQVIVLHERRQRQAEL